MEAVGSRAVLFGRFNLARHYHVGVLVIIGIPLGTFICLRFIVFSPVMLGMASYTTMLLITCAIILLSILSEVALIYLFICDPGFVDEAADEEVHRCPVCQLCVYKYDHHCDILGACIGGRNMGFFVSFLTFLSSLMWLCIYTGFVVLFSSIRETTSQLSFREVLLAMLGKEWWLSSPSRSFTLLAVAAMCYGAIFATFLAVFYWISICSGRHSLQGRRTGGLLGGSMIDVFRHMWTVELTQKALDRIARGRHQHA